MTAYDHELTGPKSNVQIAKEYGVSESTVRRARKRLGVTSLAAPGRSADATPSAAEEHKPDGTSSYTIPSHKAWGHEDFCDFIRSKGQDPDEVEFSWGVTSTPSGGYFNKLLNVRPKKQKDVSSFDLANFYVDVEKAGKSRKTEKPPQPGYRSLVVCLADWQLGKLGRRGGTPETLRRLHETRKKLRVIFDEGEYQEIILLSLGDGIEGFESGGNPMFTNDLSLPDQLDAFATELFRFVDLSEGFADTVVATVPSNHAAWRRGKQTLGKPTDDFGIFVSKQIEKMTKELGWGTQWLYPEPYDESVAVTAKGGAVIGAVHGNQFAPGKAVEWWSKQVFGSQAVTVADVLASGHYHSFEASVAGTNAANGRERYWLGAPTVDNGSDWFRNVQGRDSEPGTLIFEVDEDGFDLAGLRII